MELVYCWIGDNGINLKDIELSFGGEYILKYDKVEKKLRIRKNKDYIENFFNKEGNNEISNITGIIGENGAGKSSILDYIRGYFFDGGIVCSKVDEEYVFNNDIIAVKYNKKLIVFINDGLINNESNILYDKLINVEVVIYGNKKVSHTNSDKLLNKNLAVLERSQIFNDIACVYMSNIFDMMVPDYNSNPENGYYDISTNGLLDELEKGLITIGDSINPKTMFIDEEPGKVSNKFNISETRRYKLYRILQQIKYLSDNIENYEYINNGKFRLPQYITISTDSSYKRYLSSNIFAEDKYLLRCENQDNINEIEKLIYKKLEFNIKGCNDDSKKDKFTVYKTIINRTITSYFNDIERIFINTSEYNDEFNKNIKLIYKEDLIDKDVIELINLMNKSIIKTIDKLKDVDEYFKKFNHDKKLYKDINAVNKSYCNFINGIEELIFKSEYVESNIFDQISNIKSSGVYHGVVKKEGNLIIKLNKESLEEINELINLYISLDSTHDFMAFIWRNISSGEYALLDTYSKLYSLKDKIEQKNIILIVDEGELYLHPEWQRQYINILVEYIPKIYKGRSVQIIFASNSPFLASDMPKNNIIALKKDDNGIYLADNISSRETFGANISKLLGESFFMKNTMGDFARHKIESVIDILKHKEVDLEKREYAKKVIDLIEEPIIKRKLYEFYNEKYKDICKIEEIDMQIEMLKKKKADLENQMNKRLDGEKQDD